MRLNILPTLDCFGVDDDIQIFVVLTDLLS